MISFKIKFSFSLVLALFLLFLVMRPAEAVIGTGIFDYFDSALEGIEEISGFSTKIFLWIGLALTVTLLSLLTSASLLQWIIKVPIGLKNSAVAVAGWNFTLGLTNMFFILLFIIIALAFILKIEGVGEKKVLVKLIVTALLINFSFLLLGVFVDVATFFQNTILGEDVNLVIDSLNALFGGIQGVINKLFVWLIAVAGLYAVPFTAPFAQYAIIIRTLTLALFAPTLIGWLVIIFVGLGIAGLLFAYFFLFACRIFIIWALAILAPLAFACRILPGTEKWWNEWWKHLTQWTFFGIVILF